MLFSASLNYRKKKWNVINESTTIDEKLAIETIKNQIPDLYERMHKRHKKLKAIYAYNKKKHFPSDEKRQLPKVGRNDPCPFGSGKKYKKCCLGK
jgi:preprotein translocase subunit SecA